MKDFEERNRSLSQQLEAYVVAVRANRGRWKDRFGSWRAYAAAVGSGLALATSAEADIIYSGPNRNVSVTAFGSASRSVHAMFTGGAGFNLFAEFTVTPFVRQRLWLSGGVNVLGLRLRPNPYNSNFVKRLSSGAKISAGAGTFHPMDVVEGRFRSGIKGSFPPPKTGFAGVSFQVAGQTDYGWIRLKVTDAGAGDNSPHQLTAVDWAYDNTGAPILAGETQAPSVVPEPSTFGLALLAAGSAGVLAWRRRRQAVAAADS
jgi:hypothetical protein